MSSSELSPPLRPTERLDTAWIVGTSIAAALAIIVALALASELPAFVPALPVLYLLATTASLVATYLLAVRAAATEDDAQRWMAWAYGLTGIAMGIQILGFPTIAPDGGILGTTSTGAAALYVLWHVIIDGFAILATQPRTRTSRAARRAAVFVAAASIGYCAWGGSPLPILIESDGGYSPLLETSLGVVAVLSLAATVLWTRRAGKRAVWTHAWVGSSLAFGFWDIAMHTFAQERFTVFWWSSLAMRLAQFAVLAVGLLIGLVGLLRRTTEFASKAEEFGEERARRRQLEQLVESKDRFLASFAHELRTPLTSIIGLSTVLDSSGSRFSDQEVRELHALIRSEGHRLSELIEDLLVAARIEAEAISITPAATPVEAELRWARDRVESSRQVTVSGSFPPTVFVDRPRFRQILRILVDNAVAHGGHQVAIIGSQDGNVAHIEIADNGPGVPEEVITYLFDAPATGTNPGQPQRLGIGLRVARTLARLHGGELSYSRSGGWTRFRLTVPASVEELS